MSEETLTPTHNDIRYDVKVKYFKQNSYIVYEMILRDLGLGKQDLLLFRFSEISKFHDGLIKHFKGEKDRLPEFPQKKSFAFWNKTNSDPRKIEERRRELEYYFFKLLNTPKLRGLKQIKHLLRGSVKERRRTRSMQLCQSSTTGKKRKNSLPKVEFHYFLSSLKKQDLTCHQ